MFTNAKGRMLREFATKLTAVFMLTALLLLLTGAVLDIHPMRVTLVTIDEFDGTENTCEFATKQELVSGFLRENNITTGEFDKISMAASDKLFDGASITIRKGKSVSVNLDGNTLAVATTKAIVRDALLEANIILDGDDRTEPTQGSQIVDNMTVNVIRVEKQSLAENIDIPFETVEIEDNSLECGIKKVQAEGTNGLKQAVYDVVFENGSEVSRTLISETAIRQPIAKTVLVGTKPVAPGSKVVVTNAGEALNYSKKISVQATAYTSRVGAKTASGRVAQYGVIAVDPKVIPLGSKLYVESSDGGDSWSYGFCIAGDTGGVIKGNIVDLYYTSRNQCIQFGRRNAIVYVLD